VKRPVSRLLFTTMLGLMLMLSSIASAAAVTDGRLDGNDHPAVMMLLMEVDGQPAFRCSGTLIAPTYFLTAGHCAGAPGEFSGMRVFTESDVQAGIGTTNNYPFAGPNSVEAVRWAAHPLYPDAPFFVHDVGIVELAQPIVLPADEYGTLPSADEFDAWQTRRGQNDVWFTSVGYGLQASFPTAAAWKDAASRTRYVANPRLIQINVPGFTGDFSLLLSNNANTGGTCFGDSGGPNFVRGTMEIAGVTSFGINGNCAGTGGVFRLDRQNVLDFINDFMSAP
jgi:secreted trypsin-like serine protease